MKKTIYCNCAYYQFISEDVKQRVLTALTGSGEEFEAVADLCRLCAEKDERLQDWAKEGSLRIIACFPRTIKWLFNAGGAPLSQEGVEFLNMRTDSVEKILSSLPGPLENRAQEDLQLEKSDQWIPWFPVIDYDRCEHCRQCLNFCLFGVYELSEKDRVEVRKPANCKTNCPACARACPHSAIIFPKYADSPINGDEVTEESLQNQDDKPDLSRLANGNVYDAIRSRSKDRKRFSKDAGQGPSTLKELQEKLDIPSEVLASLSPADMANLRANTTKPKSNSEREASLDEPL
ncbi:MAG: ATP-binding protein [Planctomycetota bacterium]|jgi:NAD-dependent dihydropyrimidine dehydrogenase PreA subunit